MEFVFSISLQKYNLAYGLTSRTQQQLLILVQALSASGRDDWNNKIDLHRHVFVFGIDFCYSLCLGGTFQLQHMDALYC